jgi:hypothetical protein
VPGVIVVGVPGFTTPPGLVVVPPVPVPVPVPVVPVPVPAAPLPSAPAGAVTVRVTPVDAPPLPESPVSATNAAASTPSAIAATTPIPNSGPFQFGAPASLVRAAAPHRRHHSCSPSSDPPHRGHARSTATPLTTLDSSPTVVLPPAVAATLKDSSPTDG